ncbi:MGMT family protein [Desulfopila sp. IMCC35008]|uniref:MGMT family protein n=1 Tax=Desulfopila sp. IMCC35008 TaxID=2653858 RepID=UPI001F0D77A5|nr:MGMT family protein [Desulfopila sp. IMCC35008]
MTHITSFKSDKSRWQAVVDNKLAVAIPCHRVISKTGKLSGYRWGLERKKRLLQEEQDG